MAIVSTNDQNYSDIADAIRAKSGTQTTYRPDEMAAAIEAIPGGLTPTGTIQITQNGNYNVTNFAEAAVSVPGIIPAGVKSITADGTYDVTTYASANVNTKPAKGLVFGDYDADGYPHSAEFVGSWTEIPANYASGVNDVSDNMFRYISSLVIPSGTSGIGGSAFSYFENLETVDLPESLEIIGGFAFKFCYALVRINIKNDISFPTGSQQQFRGCSSLLSVSFGGEVSNIPSYAFSDDTKIELYDFSNVTSVPTLASVSSLDHKAGCVIKVPQALLSDWQNTTNWVGLTDVVWQGV